MTDNLSMSTGHRWRYPLYLRRSWAFQSKLFLVDLRSLSFGALLSEHYYIKVIRITHAAQYVIGFPGVRQNPSLRSLAVCTDKSNKLGSEWRCSGVSAGLIAICAAFTDQKSLLPKPYIIYEVSIGWISLVCFSAYTYSGGLGPLGKYGGDKNSISILMFCLVMWGTEKASLCWSEVLLLLRSKMQWWRWALLHCLF